MPFSIAARTFPRCFRSLALLAGSLLVSSSSNAQATAPAVSVGSVNVGSSASATVTFTFSATTTVSSVSVLTQGAPNLDFLPGTSGAGACAARQYLTGSTCTVAVQFKPLVPGNRFGAAVLLDSNSNKLAVGLVSGAGTGGLAQLPLATAPSTSISLPDAGANVAAAAFDGAGNLFAADSYSDGRIFEARPDGTVTRLATSLSNNQSYVTGLAVDGAGLVYFTTFYNGNSVFRFDPVTGTQTTYTTTTASAYALAFDLAGNLYVSDANGIDIVSPSGTVSNFYAGPANITGLALDSSGNLYYSASTGTNGNANDRNNSIYKIAVGQTTAALVATVYPTTPDALSGIALDPASNIYYVLNNSGLYVLPAGSSTGTLLAASSASQLTVTLSGTGNLATSLSSATVTVFNRLAASLSTASGTTTAVNAQSAPQSVTVENDGNAAVNFTAFTRSGAALASSGYTCAVGTALAVGGTCTLGVEFAPTAQGSPQTGKVTLAGNTLSPVISIQGYVTGDPALLAFSTPPPATLQNGQNAGTIVAAVEDNAGGATVSTAPVTLAVTSTNGYSNSYTVNAVNGSATFDTSGAALATGTYTYTASSTGLTGATATEAVYPYKLIFTASPATPVAAGGNAGVVQVAIRDNSGNATTQTTPVTLNVSTTGYSAVYGPVTPSNGTATFDLSGVPLTVSGSYSYTASATGLTSGTASETVTPGPATQLAVVPANASPYVGQPDSVTVTALDTYGNVATSDTDTTSLSSSDAKASLPANFALASGSATVSVKFGQPGTFSLTATDTTNASIAGSVSGIQVTAVPSYTVTTLTDDNGSASAANCSNQSLSGATPDSICSLRDAIAATNALNFTGTTNIQPIIGFASRLSGGTATMAAALNPTANVNITGPGAASLTIAPATNYAYNAFTSTTGSLAFTLSGVTVTGFGIPNSGLGAALYFNPASASVADLLTFNNDNFSNNGGTPGGTQASTYGGALYAYISTLAVTGSTFTGNSAGIGGAVYAGFAPSVTITGSTFGTQAAPNRALTSNGAALLLVSSPATISTSTFAYNTLSSNTGSGGAINTNNSLTLNTDVFLNNAAGSGGAVYSVATLTVAGSTFNNNTARTNGGAIYATNLLTVSGSSFMANQSGSSGATSGGAIYDSYAGANASITITNFLVNRAVTTTGTAEGGALYADRANLTNVLFSGNSTSGTSSSFGGAVFYTGPYIDTFTGVTFTGNSTTGATNQNGGALYATSGTLNLYNTTVTGNSAKTGGGIYKTATLNLYNSVVSGNTATGTYPDIYTAATSTNSSYAGAGTGNTCTGPCTPLLSALGSYGGGTLGAPGYTTPVMAMIPLPGSPLLAAGSTSNLNSATTDARGAGYPRTVNGNVDIGAAEANYSLLYAQQPGNVETGAAQRSSVQLYESGTAFAPGVTGGTLLLADSAGYASPLSAAVPASSPVSLSENYSTAATGDTLTASVRSSAATPVTVASVTSAAFNIGNSANATFAGLKLSAFPGNSVTGLAQTLTVTALDNGGAPYAAYTGTVTFTSTDTIATLPAAYTFTTADAGTHTFTITLNTGGTQSLTVTENTAAKTATQTGIVTTGFVWLVNPAGSLTKDYASGTAIGNYTGGGAPTNGLAFDAASNAWSLDKANSVLVEFSQAGTALSGSGYTGGGLSSPNLVAIDGLGQVWVTNANGSLSLFSNSGTALSPSTGFTGVTSAGTGYSAPTGVAIDASGNVWVANSSSNTLTEVLGGAAPAAPLSTALTNNTTGARP